MVTAAGVGEAQGMRRTSPARLLALVIAAAIPVAFGRIVLYTTPLELHAGITPFAQGLDVLLSALWLGVLVVAYVRQPGEPLWKLILVSFYADQLWLLGYIPTDITWLIGNMLSPIGSVVNAHILVSFPSGRLRARRDRWFVAFVYAWVIGWAIVGHLVYEPEWNRLPGCTGFCPDNLLLAWRNDELAALVDQVSTAPAPLIGLAAVTIVLDHYRRATPVARRALLPVAIATPLIMLQEVAWYVTRTFGPEAVHEFLATTTLAWTAFIIPVGILLGLLRARLQRSAVADLAVELAQGVPLGGLRATLARTLRDPSLELAFPDADGDGLVDGEGRPFELPPPERRDRRLTRVARDDRLLAVLVHDRALDDEDPGLVDAVASVARLSLENERLAAQVRAQLEEVRASRARIVEAADAERRRVERDLHDGAQQRLVALTMRLEAARGATQGVGELIDRTTEELRAAVAEVRSLARGLHPTVLTEAGLRAAVEALAERTPIPVEIDVPAERYPEGVEVAAYYVIAEALTNVARYAHASTARVEVRVDGSQLVVRVTDDGRGGADPERGSGIRGLVDRVSAAGGSLSVDSRPGAGTALVATIPV